MQKLETVDVDDETGTEVVHWIMGFPVSHQFSVIEFQFPYIHIYMYYPCSACLHPEQ